MLGKEAKKRVAELLLDPGLRIEDTVRWSICRGGTRP